MADTFKIITDSASDVLPSFIKENDIGVVPFYVTIDGTNYLKDGIDITSQEFYRLQRDSKQFFKTSLPSVQDYLDEFGKYPDKDILCFCLTSKFSGSYQSAVNAAGMLMEENPGRKIVVVDSRSASLGYGLKIMDAVKLRAKGFTPEDVVKSVMADEAHICLTVDTLEYLQRGGRIGKASAFAGGLLNIKPIIRLLDGELSPHSKVRGRKKALAVCTQVIEQEMGGKPDEYTIGVLHSDCHPEADEYRKMLAGKFGKAEHEVFLQELGLVIGVHIGPTLLAVACMKKNQDL